MVERLVVNTAREGITLFGLDDPRQGIVHVVGPEEGLSHRGVVVPGSSAFNLGPK